MNNGNLFIFYSVLIIGTVCAEMVPFELCTAPNPGQCTVHEVRINPCPESVDHKPCKIKRGKSASIEFDYTTDFNSSSAHGQVYWESDEGDLPFLGMNTQACQHTSCPIVTSTRQTYAYTLDVAKKFPARTYLIKWILRNPQQPEESTEMCCFRTKIKLVK